jgi:S1-C subfamily serine protease
MKRLVQGSRGSRSPMAWLGFLCSLAFLLGAGTPEGWIGIYLDEEGQALTVVEVIPDSPAAKAGLLPGDRLQALDGQPAASVGAVGTFFAEQEPGSVVAVAVIRRGQPLEIAVEVGLRPLENQKPGPRSGGSLRPGAPAGETQGPRVDAWLGLALVEDRSGVMVRQVQVDGPCQEHDVAAGDHLVALGDRSVRTLRDVDQALTARRPGDSVGLQVEREGVRRLVVVTLAARLRDGTVASDSTASRLELLQELTRLRAELQRAKARITELERQLDRRE